MSPRSKSVIKHIKSRDGRVIYSMPAKTIREVIQYCVENGLSLKDADLSGLNLKHLDMTGGDFTNAIFDGSNLVGAKMDNCKASGASFNGVSGQGMSAVSSDFSHARIGKRGDFKTNFEGAIFTFSRFDGATVIDGDFSQCAMSSTTHIGATYRKTSFEQARLHNADWVDARVTGCNFKGASMYPRMNLDSKHHPDRTANSVIIGNMYDSHTSIGADGQGFAVDAFVVKAVKIASFAAVTSSLYMATEAVPFDLEGTLVEQIGKPASLVLAASVLAWLKAPVEDFVRDKGIELFADMTVKVRSAASELVRRGKAIGSLVVAFAKRTHADHIEQVIHAKHGNFVQRLLAAGRGAYDVIVCDQDHLAEALSNISEAMNNRVGHRHSVILVRLGRGAHTVPRALVINGNGGIEALWDKDDKGDIRHQAWDSGKIPSAKNDEGKADRFMAPFNSHINVVKQFVDCVLNENAAIDLKIDSRTHMIRQGLDGSIIVTRQSDGRLDNHRGSPAVITPEGVRMYFENAIRKNRDGGRFGGNENETENFAA